LLGSSPRVVLVGVRFEHKLAIVGGSLVAPGFAQALAGRRLAPWIWLALTVVPTLLATVSVWCPLMAMLVRLAAAVGAIVELRRFEDKPAWWRRPSPAVFAIGIASFAVLRLSVEGFKIPSSSMYPSLEIGDHIFVDKLSPYWRAPERGEVIVFEYPCAHDRDYVKRVIAVGGDAVEVRCNVVYVNGVAIPNELVDANGTYQDYDEHEDRWFVRQTSRYRERLGGHTYEVFHDPDRPSRDRERDTLTAGDARDFPNLETLIAPSCTRGELYNRPTSSAGQLTGKIIVKVPDGTPCEQQAHFVVPAGGLFVMGDNRNNANDSRYWGVVSVDEVRGRVLGIWINDPPGGNRKWSRLGAVE